MVAGEVIGIISINHTSQSDKLVEGDDSMVKSVTFQQVMS